MQEVLKTALMLSGIGYCFSLPEDWALAILMPAKITSRTISPGLGLKRGDTFMMCRFFVNSCIKLKNI
jgi:hypothetical protein